MSQGQKLFARTVRENGTYGANEDPVKDAQIWNALETANIAEWVKSLPEDLNEVLGNGEVVVSGGQLQRLNVAHLFCTCADADLVILDEEACCWSDCRRFWKEETPLSRRTIPRCFAFAMLFTKCPYQS